MSRQFNIPGIYKRESGCSYCSAIARTEEAIKLAKEAGNRSLLFRIFTNGDGETSRERVVVCKHHSITK